MRLRQLPVLLLVGIVFSFGAGESAVAEEGHSIRVTPILDNGFNLIVQELPRAGRTEEICKSYSEFKEVLKSKLQDRISSISIHLQYDFDFYEVKSIINTAFDEIKLEDEYTYYNIDERKEGEIIGYHGDASISLPMVYHTSYAEEQDVTQKVAEIIAGIITPTMNDEDKVKAIHDWVVLNVEYDLTYQRHSAYEALFGIKETVCCGYTLLVIRMLRDVGIESKYISSNWIDSDGKEINHAWNLVHLCGHWYHLDATWDDPITNPPDPDFIRHTYYLLSDAEILDTHLFDTSAYPDAPDSYVEGVCDDVTSYELQVEPSSRNVSASSGTTTFTVSRTGTGSMNWTATENFYWFYISGPSSGTDSGTITISYDENTSTGSRSGTIHVSDPNANNNPVSVQISQAGASPDPPDLVIQSPGASPNALNPGESLTASCTIVNQGGSTADASTIKYYLSSDSQYDTGDTYLGSRSIDSINSGWTVSPNRTLTIPSDTVPGTWHILFKADANNTVNESNEFNNTASIQISVISDTLSWVTSRDEAVSAARAQGKTILLIAGRETCSNTTYMRDTVCQQDDPPIRETIENHYIPWFCNVDGSSEHYSYTGGLGSFTLPLICRIDPDNPDAYIDRTTGIQDSDVFYNRLIGGLVVIKGDLNSNAKLDVGDAILALQVCAGINVSVQLAADVNDDNRIGMEEALYILNMLSRDSTYADGFESGDFSHLSWLRSRSAPTGAWTVTDEYPGSGWYAAQSAHEQSVNDLVLETTLDSVKGQVQYEFAIGVEDSPFGDPVSMFEGFPSEVRLKFYVDNRLEMEWSHIVGYTSRSHSVSPGRHSFKWVSENTSSSAQEAVWLDNVVVK